ncbi:MAG: YkoF family thiamine/hydroxymethylpyrimidine-binding protein [Pseudomonadota bacterium]
MRVVVDISLYPLTETYLTPIKNVIERLRAYEAIDVEVNRLSTQLTGEYRDVMQALQNEIEPSLADSHQAVFVMKILNADKAGY